MYVKRTAIEYIRAQLTCPSFCSRHKRKANDLTRKRCFTFAMIFIVLLRKSVKSLQIVLNELFMQGRMTKIVTASGYTQARQKLKHTAFIELNEGIIDLYYTAPHKRWMGYRCFGVDGSTLILPNSPEIKEKFGTVTVKNQCKEKDYKYTCATYECCYDVLNRIAFKNTVAPGITYEANLATQMLTDMKEDDLMIFDRGYASYLFLAQLTKSKSKYIVRCPKNSFKETKPLFDQEGEQSQIATLEIQRNHKQEAMNKNLPLTIQVRLVSLILPTGEVEVLITNLIDLEVTHEEFQRLYFLRWGVESFFNLLKSRLMLENFTGKSVESVLQDFWSTIFLSNVETIFTEPADHKIKQSPDTQKLKQKVNKAVSFNAIKNMAFELFYETGSFNLIIEKLDLLFKTNTIVERKDRSPPRTKTSYNKSYNFWRYLKKQVF